MSVISQHDSTLHISSQDECLQNVFRNVWVACNAPWDFTFLRDSFWSVTVRIQSLSLGLQLYSMDKIKLSMSGILDVNAPHCTVGHYHPGPSGASLHWLAWRSSNAISYAETGWQTQTCTQAHLLAQSTIVDKSFNYLDWPKQQLPPALSLAQGHANTHSRAHTNTHINSVSL